MEIRQVTVFGGTGVIGRYVVRALAARGYRVRVAVRHPYLADFTKLAGDVGQVMASLANVRYPDSVRAAIAGSQAVVNACGIHIQRGKQKFKAVHDDGSRHIAEAARDARVSRVIHISGLGADNHRPGNRFVASKAMAEHQMNRAFPNVTILRPSVVFCPEDKFFNRLALTARMMPMVPVFNGGTSRFQPVHAGDIAEAATRCLAEARTQFGVFELGGPRIYTYRELVELTLRMTGLKRRIISLPAFPVRIGAFFAELLPSPPITRDQLDLLLRDNVVRSGSQGFAELGIQPRTAEAILPMYLDRYRTGGRYDVAAPA